jgi:N-carbamoyl-L-amino-acid hydrolase
MAASDFEGMWRDLAPVGRSASSGGYFRQPWTSAESELRAWFAEACADRGLTVETDGIGNQVAWWGGSDEPGVLTGSHLDSVLDGGAYDGPLGVVSALAAVDVLRDRGFTPYRPLGIGVFVEEEGSRFGRACLGSRLLTGATTWEQARELTDRDGTFLGDAVAAAGLDPSAGLLSLDRVGTFVELHVEQGRDLVDRGVAVGLASEIWPHGRWRFDFAGEGNHAGTTRLEDRRDPMLTFANTVLAARKKARLGGGLATFGRVSVTPNGTNAIASSVRAWLDSRAPDEDTLSALVAAVTEAAIERGERDGVAVAITPESRTPIVEFPAPLRDRLAAALRPAFGAVPVLPTGAGHDAGILAAEVPTAMIFVRNPTGVSHAPAEYAEYQDCLIGVTALADVIADLAGHPAPSREPVT